MAEGLDLAQRPEGKWLKALIATARQIHQDQINGVRRSDDEIWATVPEDVRMGYQGDKARLVADVRRTIAVWNQYANVFKEPAP